jgi:SpoVK/Ycf46/Vps4 family AAA+-type ATPase
MTWHVPWQWVGEAERQLRVLFEEARRLQPAIIFFDEIDGLAPVRSSKQDQVRLSVRPTYLILKLSNVFLENVTLLREVV